MTNSFNIIRTLLFKISKAELKAGPHSDLSVKHLALKLFKPWRNLKTPFAEVPTRRNPAPGPGRTPRARPPTSSLPLPPRPPHPLSPGSVFPGSPAPRNMAAATRQEPWNRVRIPQAGNSSTLTVPDPSATLGEWDTRRGSARLPESAAGSRGMGRDFLSAGHAGKGRSGRKVRAALVASGLSWPVAPALGSSGLLRAKTGAWKQGWPWPGACSS